jgi:triosephosphate isomerase
MSEWLHGNNHHSQKIVIFCPPFTILSTLKTALLELDHKNLQVFLGAQDISPFAPGSHTGEESAEQLAGLVEYVIIGHSERRNDFHETDHKLQRKFSCQEC